MLTREDVREAHAQIQALDGLRQPKQPPQPRRVHILASCRNLELLKATLLVFETLRVGFPTWEVKVWMNSLEGNARYEVMKRCTQVGAEWIDTHTVHHVWIEKLVHHEQQPIVLCDTDMIFWKSVEDFEIRSHMAGKLIPSFQNEYSRCWDMARLHTCLMFLSPRRVLGEVTAYNAGYLNHFCLPPANLFYPQRVPAWPLHSVFYDTLALMYAATGGQAFTDEQKDCFDHLGFGTIEDMVLPQLTDGQQLKRNREAVYANPALAKGAWRAEEEYYKKYGAAAATIQRAA